MNSPRFPWALAWALASIQRLPLGTSTVKSTALLAVGVAGGATGGVTGGALAARQLSSATQQAGVSSTQQLGGQQLSSVSREEAERQQVLAAVGLLLAAAPVVTGVAGVLRVGRVAQVASRAEQVAGEVVPAAVRAPTLAEKTAEIQNARRLKYGQATVNTLLKQSARSQSVTLPPPNARGEILLWSETVDVRPLLGNRSVGEGFTAPPALRPVPSAQHPGGTGIQTPGVPGRVYPASSVTPISGSVHSVQIGLKWDGSRWVVGQFFPMP